jgi:hypothetical protein
MIDTVNEYIDEKCQVLELKFAIRAKRCALS